MSNTDHSILSRPGKIFLANRFFVAAVILFSCSLAMSSAWHAGLGRLSAKDAKNNLLKARADQAVELSPADPETHSARALVHYNSNDLGTTLEELQRAVLLRPRDYLLWLQLGRARDEAGDRQGSLLAMQEAIALAPYYSDPRWQYGNVLYRAGRFDEAFRELGQAARSDPSLFPALMDLAWGTYPGDPAAVERIVSPRTDALRLSLARFFVKKGRTSEALSLFRASGGTASEERRKLLVELIKAKQFKTAYQVWGAGRADESGRSPLGVDRITDSGFEGQLDLSALGFSWRQERSQEAVRLSLETKGPKSGSSCLLIEWSGDSKPESPIISQLVLVESNTHYRLSFFARTQEVVTGGPPMITVTDTSGEERILGQSQPLASSTRDWQEYEAVFRTSATTEAVIISVQRQSCPVNPCPIFGRVWLDDFSLRKE
jgi:tetratricopeptide (TPR) repeat protein